MFFGLFEHVAEARAWNDSDRVVLLQCVLTGRSQEAFSSLSVLKSSNYFNIFSVLVYKRGCDRF